MTIAIGGFDPAEPDDPTWFVAAPIVDRRVTTAPLDRNCREDLQIWSFLCSLAVGGNFLSHPLAIRAGDNPPDRVIKDSSGWWGCELTELTVENLRRELAISVAWALTCSGSG